MVNLGFSPSERVVPAPDISFVRLFSDNSIGWQQRGQYAIWTGARTASEPQLRLLERVGNRVAPIEHADGGPVFHKVGAGVAFKIENHGDHWLTFDSDAMWIDTPAADGRYAFLAVGGSAGKPGTAVIDWMCPRCGAALSRHELPIGPHAFNAMLKKAEKLSEAFDADPALRTCGECHAVHPPSDPAVVRETRMPSDNRS